MSCRWIKVGRGLTYYLISIHFNLRIVRWRNDWPTWWPLTKRQGHQSDVATLPLASVVRSGYAVAVAAAARPPEVALGGVATAQCLPLTQAMDEARLATAVGERNSAQA
jgi:hypothetical protein